MGHEISQFDIPDRQLLASSAQAGMWSDIGEAKITHTIFGRARVRVIREKDRIIRAWLLAALAVLVIAIAAWQGWIALQQSKLLAVLPPLSERISIGAPVFHPATIAPAAARSSAGSKPESLIQTEIDSLVASPNVLPPRPPPLNAKSMDMKPVTAQPLMAGKPQPVKPQTAPLATNSVSSITQTGVQPHARKSAPIPAAPAVATPPATQPAANRPAPAEPSSRKDTLATSLAGNNQPSGPIKVQPANAQPQANAQTQVNARGTAIIFVQPQDNAQP